NPEDRGDFAGFPFEANVATAWPGAGAAHPFLDPLLDRVIGAELNPLGTQPDWGQAKAELELLVYGRSPERPGLKDNGGAARTQTIAKAACAALLGSAAMLVQ